MIELAWFGLAVLGVVAVWFMINRKGRENPETVIPDETMPAAPTPEKYRRPGDHPRPLGGGGGPQEPL